MKTGYRGLLALFIFLLSLDSVSAQDNDQLVSRKGKIFFSWGWNRTAYSRSDIHFTGPNHNFTLKNVKATDRPSSASWKNYVDLKNVTVPQYNMRIGYFINDQYSISVAWDHLKYVAVQGQTVRISGEIAEGNEFDGVYDNEPIEIKKRFLRYEHTNGLNTANVELRRYAELFKSNIFRVEVIEGAGFGLLFPRTDAELFNKTNHDEFHLSGFEVHGLLGLKSGIGRVFFVQSEFKLIYHDMDDIYTTLHSEDRASQNFFGYHWNVVFGAYIGLPKFRK